MVKNNVRSGHQCAQTPPLSTRLTARPIWDKTKNKAFMETAGFHENWKFSKDHLQGIVTPMFYLLDYWIIFHFEGISKYGDGKK